MGLRLGHYGPWLVNVASVIFRPKHGAILVYLRLDPDTVELEGGTRDMRGLGHLGTGGVPGGAPCLDSRPGEGGVAHPAGVRGFLMLSSSGRSHRRCHFVAPSVADQGPDDVDTSAGEGEHGLDVPLPFRARFGRRTAVSSGRSGR